MNVFRITRGSFLWIISMLYLIFLMLFSCEDMYRNILLAAAKGPMANYRPLQPPKFGYEVYRAAWWDYAAARVRGTRGGRNKQRQINTVIGRGSYGGGVERSGQYVNTANLIELSYNSSIASIYTGNQEQSVTAQRGSNPNNLSFVNVSRPMENLQICLMNARSIRNKADACLCSLI
jgi:hypothetical protein